MARVAELNMLKVPELKKLVADMSAVDEATKKAAKNLTKKPLIDEIIRLEKTIQGCPKGKKMFNPTGK